MAPPLRPAGVRRRARIRTVGQVCGRVRASWFFYVSFGIEWRLVPEKPEQRKLVWLVDSLDRLTSFPPAVQRRLGFALYQAQIGQKHESAKTLRGFEQTVWQVRADDPSGTYRAVYVTGIGDCDSETRSGADPAAACASAQVVP